MNPIRSRITENSRCSAWSETCRFGKCSWMHPVDAAPRAHSHGQVPTPYQWQQHRPLPENDNTSIRSIFLLAHGTGGRIDTHILEFYRKEHPKQQFDSSRTIRHKRTLQYYTGTGRNLICSLSSMRIHVSRQTYNYPIRAVDAHVHALVHARQRTQEGR